MTDKDSFGHDITSLARAYKNSMAHIDVAQKALKQAMDNIEFAKDIADQIHKEVYPLLPEGKRNKTKPNKEKEQNEN